MATVRQRLRAGAVVTFALIIAALLSTPHATRQLPPPDSPLTSGPGASPRRLTRLRRAAGI